MSAGWWAVPMLISAGLFAGGVGTIAWERVPAWRAADLSGFRTTFAYTLRRVDRLQPALLAVCLVSTIGFAAGASDGARTLAVLAAAGLAVVLVGSLAWLVPLQRRLASAAEQSPPELTRLRARWLRGHLARTVVALAALVLAVLAAVS